jgi:TPR repeat protein
MRYQLARALQAANQYDRAFALLTALADDGYAAAFDNLGFHHMRLRQTETAIAYHRKGADAGDPEAMVTVAELIEKGTTQPRHANEFWDLLQNAAQRGHDGARKTLAEKQATSQFIQSLPGMFRDFINRR